MKNKRKTSALSEARCVRPRVLLTWKDALRPDTKMHPALNAMPEQDWTNPTPVASSGAAQTLWACFLDEQRPAISVPNVELGLGMLDRDPHDFRRKAPALSWRGAALQYLEQAQA